MRENERVRVVVVGGGAGGVELALAVGEGSPRLADVVILFLDAALPYQFALVTRVKSSKDTENLAEKILAALKARNFEVYENGGVEEVRSRVVFKLRRNSV